MYSISNQILEQLKKYNTLISDNTEISLEELKLLRTEIQEGLAFCCQLYRKTGSIEEAVSLYKTLRTEVKKSEKKN